MAAQKQPVVHVADFSDINWSSQPAALHHRHGSNIRLSENNTVAERVDRWKSAFGGVVMTAEPVSVGAVFQVTVLEKVKGWRGSLVSCVCVLNQECEPCPSALYNVVQSLQYIFVQVVIVYPRTSAI